MNEYTINQPIGSTVSNTPFNKSFEKLRAGYEEVQMVKSSIENAYPEAYRLARKFHELYEQQAPFFGYITNPNSREFYPNSNNARLMAYVCYTIVEDEITKAREDERETMMAFLVMRNKLK